MSIPQSGHEPAAGYCCVEAAATAGIAHTTACRERRAHPIDPHPTLDPPVDPDAHPFVGEGHLCTGRLGTEDGPQCGNGPTAPVHTRAPESAEADPNRNADLHLTSGESHRYAQAARKGMAEAGYHPEGNLADHPFVPQSSDSGRMAYADRCAYAKSRTDASTFCWRTRDEHPDAAGREDH